MDTHYIISNMASVRKEFGIMRLPPSIQRFFRRFSVPNLMNYIIGGMAIVFIFDMVAPRMRLSQMLYLNRYLALKGEIWRFLTFVILPPNSSPLFILFALYLYWMIGTALENQWGTDRFNMFYWVGVIGNIIACMISGYADNSYLNMSLFLAFAALNPDYPLMLFFFLPIKIKYLALLDVGLYIYQFIIGGPTTRWMILFSLLNLILFLGGDLLNTLRRESRYWKNRSNFRNHMH